MVLKITKKNLGKFFPLGYANEVGEAFRSWVHVNVVRFSYVVSSGYVVADAFHKSEQMYKVSVCSLKSIFEAN